MIDDRLLALPRILTPFSTLPECPRLVADVDAACSMTLTASLRPRLWATCKIMKGVLIIFNYQ